MNQSPLPPPITWLLSSYPREWQVRYGEELRETLSQHRLSVRTVLDLCAGSADAWLHSRRHLEARVSCHDRLQGATALILGALLLFSGFLLGWLETRDLNSPSMEVWEQSHWPLYLIDQVVTLCFVLSGGLILCALLALVVVILLRARSNLLHLLRLAGVLCLLPAGWLFVHGFSMAPFLCALAPNLVSLAWSLRHRQAGQQDPHQAGHQAPRMLFVCASLASLAMLFIVLAILAWSIALWPQAAVIEHAAPGWKLRVVLLLLLLTLPTTTGLLALRRGWSALITRERVFLRRPAMDRVDAPEHSS